MTDTAEYTMTISDDVLKGFVINSGWQDDGTEMYKLKAKELIANFIKGNYEAYIRGIAQAKLQEAVNVEIQSTLDSAVLE